MDRVEFWDKALCGFPKYSAYSFLDELARQLNPSQTIELLESICENNANVTSVCALHIRLAIEYYKSVKTIESLQSELETLQREVHKNPMEYH